MLSNANYIRPKSRDTCASALNRMPNIEHDTLCTITINIF